MVGFIAFSMTFGGRAGKLVCIRKNDLRPSACSYQAVMYRLCHGAWPWVLALDDILPCCLFEGPHNGLWRRSLQFVWYWIHAIAMYGNDDEVVLLLCFLRHWQTKDLIDVFPGKRKLDVACSANGSNPSTFTIEDFEGELLALRYREANTRVRLEGFCRGAVQATTTC